MHLLLVSSIDQHFMSAHSKVILDSPPGQKNKKKNKNIYTYRGLLVDRRWAALPCVLPVAVYQNQLLSQPKNRTSYRPSASLQGNLSYSYVLSVGAARRPRVCADGGPGVGSGRRPAGRGPQSARHDHGGDCQVSEDVSGAQFRGTCSAQC